MASNGVKVFKSASKLKIEINRPAQCMLSTAERGDVFLREGAIHMRVEYDGSLHDQARRSNETGQYSIVNLQTGRVWLAEDCAVEHVKAVVTLEGE